MSIMYCPKCETFVGPTSPVCPTCGGPAGRAEFGTTPPPEESATPHAPGWVAWGDRKPVVSMSSPEIDFAAAAKRLAEVYSKPDGVRIITSVGFDIKTNEITLDAAVTPPMPSEVADTQAFADAIAETMQDYIDNARTQGIIPPNITVSAPLLERITPDGYSLFEDKPAILTDYKKADDHDSAWAIQEKFKDK